jgi:hypothetical protein
VRARVRACSIAPPRLLHHAGPVRRGRAGAGRRRGGQKAAFCPWIARRPLCDAALLRRGRRKAGRRCRVQKASAHTQETGDGQALQRAGARACRCARELGDPPRARGTCAVSATGTQRGGERAPPTDALDQPVGHEPTRIGYGQSRIAPGDARGKHKHRDQARSAKMCITAVDVIPVTTLPRASPADDAAILNQSSSEYDVQYRTGPASSVHPAPSVHLSVPAPGGSSASPAHTKALFADVLAQGLQVAGFEPRASASGCCLANGPSAGPPPLTRSPTPCETERDELRPRDEVPELCRESSDNLILTMEPACLPDGELPVTLDDATETAGEPLDFLLANLWTK